MCGFAYVDDTDLLQTAGTTQHFNDPDRTIRNMQKSIDCWEGVAKSTGGAIATDKSWWYIIHFDWDGSKWSYGSLNNVLEDELSCLDKDGVRKNLKYIPSSQASGQTH